MKRQILLISISFLLCLISCKDNDSNGPSYENQVIIGNDDYNNASSDQVSISDLAINENRLKFNLSASGCDGSTWTLKLISSEEILYSDPPQRNLKISFQNNEDCRALISKEFSFDITALEVSGTKKVFLNIVNAGEQILYEY